MGQPPRGGGNSPEERADVRRALPARRLADPLPATVLTFAAILSAF